MLLFSLFFLLFFKSHVKGHFSYSFILQKRKKESPRASREGSKPSTRPAFRKKSPQMTVCKRNLCGELKFMWHTFLLPIDYSYKGGSLGLAHDPRGKNKRRNEEEVVAPLCRCSSYLSPRTLKSCCRRADSFPLRSGNELRSFSEQRTPVLLYCLLLSAPTSSLLSYILPNLVIKDENTPPGLSF